MRKAQRDVIKSKSILAANEREWHEWGLKKRYGKSSRCGWFV
jgi:hypothetical protein